MSESLLFVIAGAIGAIIAAALSYYSSRETNDSKDRNAWRGDILKRQELLETRVDKLDAQIVIWRARYWAMYGWIVDNFSGEQGVKPPGFHDMDMDALMEEDKKRGTND